MTLKNAGAGLPHGGGKSVIFGNRRMPPGDKQRIIRAFASEIRDLSDYVPGPDMGTDELAMGWIADEIGRAVGLPREIGGIPLDEIGATGFGVAAAVDVAARRIGLDLAGARIAIQGFGAVGKHAARFLREKGAVLVAASDSQGTIVAPGGLDVEALIAHKASDQPVTSFTGGRAASADAILDVACDVWIPAARPDVVTTANADRLKTRIVAEGANIPCSKEAEEILAGRGVLVLPDFIANAGGVICAAVEYRGGTQAQAFAAIDEKIRANMEAVLTEVERTRVAPRAAATALALARVRRAGQTRRWQSHPG
jgi:glutamate dehydrogenase/leucine dehydrogenase